MTGSTSCLTTKELMSACGSIRVEINPRSWLWCRDCKLIKLKSAKFWCDAITSRVRTDVPKTSLGGNRKFCSVIKSGIEECPDAVHFYICNKRIPVGHSSPSTGPSVLIISRKTKRVWKERCSRYIRPSNNAIGDLLRIKGFSIEKKLSIKFSRSPTVENGFDSLHIGSQEISYGLEIGRERCNCSNVQIAVRPTVKPTTNSKS